MGTDAARIAELEAERDEYRDALTLCVAALDSLMGDTDIDGDESLEMRAMQAAAPLVGDDQQPTIAELHARVREVLGERGWYTLFADECGGWTWSVEWSGCQLKEGLPSERACLLHILESEGEEP
jgi:hypothetical protein